MEEIDRFTVRMFNYADFPLNNYSPHPPQPKFKKCDSLEEALEIGRQYKDIFDRVIICRAGDDNSIVEFKSGEKVRPTDNQMQQAG